MEDLPVPVMAARNFSRLSLGSLSNQNSAQMTCLYKADCVLLALMEQVGTGEVGSVSCVGSPNGQKLKEGNLQNRKTKK